MKAGSPKGENTRMNSANGNPGMNRLAQVIQGRIKKNQDADSALILDFAEIQSDYSLLTNTYPLPIPKGDYMICRQLTLGAEGDYLTNMTVAGHHEHTHDVLIPETMRKLKPGDRVLVAWVQNDAVVIDLVLPASVL